MAKNLHNNLSLYQSKRNFSITNEPAEGGETIRGFPSFVVQKHWASSLHYDFRLELDGTMKSWAIPKGPSLDPKVKRMAIHMEDHPIAYNNFEGDIPPKQYGAGKVIIWDKGIWQPIGNASEGYLNGNLKFELQGQKLYGKWALVRIKASSEKQEAWLLIKEKDHYAKPAAEFNVTEAFPDSVANPPLLLKTVADVVPKMKSGKKNAPFISDVKKEISIKDKTNSFLKEAIKAELPNQLSPQLAILMDSAPADSGEWNYEIKFDGYRLLTRINAQDIKFFTRNGNDWTVKLPLLHSEIARLGLPSGWYDGEIIVQNAQGVPDFGLLQLSFDATKTNDVILYMFDLPYFEHYDLRSLPLEKRRAILKDTLSSAASSERIRYSEAFTAPSQQLLNSACQLGLEGVIAKRLDSEYVSERSPNWIKLKCSQRQEFVIGGFTEPRGARMALGSLLLGTYEEGGDLIYAGNVGSGFNQRTLVDINNKLQPLIIKNCPFTLETGIIGKPNWVEPLLIAEISFSQWTKSGHIRHAVFHGLRGDKDPKMIHRERAVSASSISKLGSATELPSHALSSRLNITHPDRVIDASKNITKIELVRYYELVGDLMMEHLKGRPVSLLRAPGGIDQDMFFQKHAETEKLPGVQKLYLKHQLVDTPNDETPLLELKTKQGLLSAAQWNVIEFHTGNSTIPLEHPDRMVFDLDPGEHVAWQLTQEAAQLVHAFLLQLNLDCYLKTSGGKGLHVVVPLQKTHDFEAVKNFSKAVVLHLVKTIPTRFVAKSGPKNRIKKIFIDYLRNSEGATTVCAWSARARPGFGISVPITWDELTTIKGGDHITIRTAHTRLGTGNTPWENYANVVNDLTKAIKTLEYAK